MRRKFPLNFGPDDLRFVDGRPMVKVDGECWVWQGKKHKGYGRMSYGGRSSVQAHIVTYREKHGNPPKGTELSHTCHRRSCINPDHVQPKSKGDNLAERFCMPTLSFVTREEIEQMLLADYPNGYIANEFGISVWAVRKIASQLTWKDQFTIFEEVPF